ncbi:MAG: hypothetical protein ACREEQ_05480, partial [Caulobacteraceae bacterium]
MRIPGVGFINGRMSMGARLVLLSVLFVVPTATLLTMFVGKSLSDIQFAKTELAGTQYLSDIWPAYKAAVSGMRGDGAAQAALAGSHDAFDAKFGTAGKFQAFASGASGEVKINAGKDLIGGVADGANLTLDPDLDSYSAIQVGSVDLPGILADSTDVRDAMFMVGDDATREVKLVEAMQRLRIGGANFQKHVSGAMRDNANLRTALSGHAAAMTAALNKLLGDETGLIAGQGAPEADADIQALQQETDQAWQVTHKALQAELDTRVGALTNKLVANLALAVGSLILAGILAAIIAIGLSGRINALLKVMDRLIGGDTEVEVPHTDDRNETGRIAGTVGAFRQSLIDTARLQSEQAEQKAQAEKAQLAEQQREAAASRDQGQVVTSLAEGLSNLSQGVLTYRIEQPFADAYEKLRGDFNGAMDELQDTMK